MSQTPITDNTLILLEAAKIKRNLDQDNHDRWGFAIYRCTYGDDATWDRFKNIITAERDPGLRPIGNPQHTRLDIL